MRKLLYSINLEDFKEIKKDLIPTIFTKHQFKLIEKKFGGRRMTQSEKNEFSRTISRKMKAINKILEKETDSVFVYGKDEMRKYRLKLVEKFLKTFSRKFKNKHIIISGSFLYKNKYNDIDIFVISKYDKDDYKIGKFHINYLTEDVYNSLFFASLRRLCISNKKIIRYEIKEKINLNTFISIYQELFNDLDYGRKGIKHTLREFLMQAAHISKSAIPNSLELTNQTDSILKIKNPREIIKRIFTKSAIMNSRGKRIIKIMKHMIDSYKDLMIEYKQFKDYYLDLIQPFKEVISIASG